MYVAIKSEITKRKNQKMAKNKVQVSKADREKCRILTPEFRVSYPHVFKPQQIKPTDKPKYSVTGLFSKKSDLAVIKQAIKQAKINAFGEDKKKWPEDLESPVTDGDSVKNADKEGYKGHWAIKFSCGEDTKPGVVDERNVLVSDPSKFYPGCYAHAWVFAYVWEYMGKQGVGFILDHVQKTKDGDSFGGRKPIDQAFSPLVGDDDETEESEDDDADF